jgi:(p)ppGpp synthase/HD superfamily hydrolase
MRINEVDSAAADSQRLAAMTQFLIGRSDDTDAKKVMNLDSYLQLAQNQGISLTKQSLIDLSQRAPLKNLIQNVEDDIVTFRGDEGDKVTDTMTVDQARKKVDSMAKRAAKKGM